MTLGSRLSPDALAKLKARCAGGREVGGAMLPR